MRKLQAQNQPTRHFQSSRAFWVCAALLILLALLPKSAKANSQYEQDYINAVLPWAQQVHAMYGVPISVAIAQSAKESGWYVDKKVQNDYFNIKYTGPKCDPWTTGPTPSNWRAYNSGGDAFLGYGYLLTTSQYYIGTGGAGIDCRPDFNNPLQFLHDIAFDGFDGGPGASTQDKQNYYDIVASIISYNNLTQYDQTTGSGFDPANPYVDTNYTGTEVGTASQPFRTIAAGVNAASTTQSVTLHIAPGWYKEKITITRNIHMVTNGSGTVRIGG